MSSPFQKKFSAKSPVGSTPLTKKAPLYVTDDKKSGVQPNRANVEVDKTTRLTREGTIVKNRNSGGVVIGGGYDSEGNYVPRTAAQKSLATKERLATKKAKAKADTRSGADKKAALEAKRKAKKAADLKSSK